MVMLVRGDQTMRMEDWQSFSGTRGMRAFKRSGIVLCGSQHADYFVGRGEGMNGGQRVEQTVEGVVSMRTDAQAEAALHSICPKG